MEGVKEAGSGGDILGGSAEESEVLSGIGEIDAGEVRAANVAISESESVEGGGSVSEVEVRSEGIEAEGGVAANVALAESTGFIAAENGGGGTAATNEDVSGLVEAEEEDAVSVGVSEIVVGAAGSDVGRRGRKRKEPTTKKTYPKKPKTKKKEDIHDGETFNPQDPDSVRRLEGHAICMWKEEDGQNCMLVFYDDVKMTRHRIDSHWERSFTCTNCEFTCKSHQMFRRHFQKPGNCKREDHWKVTDGKAHLIRKNVLVENYIPPSSTSSSAAADAFSGSVSSRGEAASVSRPISPQPSTSTGGGAVGSSPILPEVPSLRFSSLLSAFLVYIYIFTILGILYFLNG
ncbi:unnamed protein product [Orchesella dallaii]|uniref:Uncharacterized protein n=1 Tax=Orchesella dallaii TaxID=48710 RepID=A0ABP1QET6_9HEXA